MLRYNPTPSELRAMKTTNPNATEALIAHEVAEAVKEAVKSERERCAQVCEQLAEDYRNRSVQLIVIPQSALKEAAAKIRKGTTP